jgi:hypothetical protein
VAGLLSIGFFNVEGLRSKLATKDFLDLFGCNDIFGITESWLGLEVCDIMGYTSQSKGRCKIAKCGRNLGGLAVYITQDISTRITEILSNVIEVTWLAMREVNNIQVVIRLGFVYNALQISRWYNPFLQGNWKKLRY